MLTYVDVCCLLRYGSESENGSDRGRGEENESEKGECARVGGQRFDECKD